MEMPCLLGLYYLVSLIRAYTKVKQETVLVFTY